MQLAHQFLLGPAALCVIACGVQDSVTLPGSQPGFSAATVQAPQKPTPEKSSAKSGAPTLRFTKQTIHDPMAGCDACTVLVPEGWKIEGGITWQLQWSNLASAAVRIYDPRSKAALEVFPIVPGCWNENGALPPGQNYMGSYVARPTDVAGYVSNYFVPGFRARADGLKIGAATPLPAVTKAVEASVQEAGLQKQVMAGKVRLDYTTDGTPIAEDVFMTLVVSRAPQMPGAIYWGPQHQYSFRAEKDKLDAIAPLLHAIVSSVQVDLRWYAAYAEVQKLWSQGQMQSIRNAGEISRAISKNNDAMIAGMRSSWEQRQASQDRVYQQFSESIRGVETYTNSIEGRAVELPSGYTDVWANTSGEYILSNTGGYDPNVGSTLQWRRLDQAR